MWAGVIALLFGGWNGGWDLDVELDLGVWWHVMEISLGLHKQVGWSYRVLRVE